jgi:hypothetical protein
VGQCGEPDGDIFYVDGMPNSPSTPSLFQRCMFGFDADSNACYKNFNHHDLPIVDSYYDSEGRATDVYATITTFTPTKPTDPVDLFVMDDGVTPDVCRPSDYDGTDGFFLYGSPEGGIPHYSPAPTIKNCKGRQGAV